MVNEENGEKKVTVTTTENGETKTEVYEGDEADEYLKEHKKDKKFKIKIEDGDSKKKVKKIIIENFLILMRLHLMHKARSRY